MDVSTSAGVRRLQWAGDGVVGLFVVSSGRSELWRAGFGELSEHAAQAAGQAQPQFDPAYNRRPRAMFICFLAAWG